MENIRIKDHRKEQEEMAVCQSWEHLRDVSQTFFFYKTLKNAHAQMHKLIIVFFQSDIEKTQ